MTVVDDTYTGHVEPQTASRRTLPGATVIKMSVGPMDNNVYLVTCSATGETLLIDAANDPELLVDLVREYAPKLGLIVTSHQHFDHWQALEAVAAATGAPTAVHQLDAEPLPVKPDRFLANGDTISVGDLTIDLARRWVTARGERVKLTPIEYDILKTLASYSGRVITHRQLLKQVWGPQSQDETQYLRVYIRQLRLKIERDPTRPEYILTEPGVGYRLALPGD